MINRLAIAAAVLADNLSAAHAAVVAASAAVDEAEAAHRYAAMRERIAARVADRVISADGPPMISDLEARAVFVALREERGACLARIEVIERRVAWVRAVRKVQALEAVTVDRLVAELAERESADTVPAEGSRVLITPSPELSALVIDAARNRFAEGPHAVGTGG